MSLAIEHYPNKKFNISSFSFTVDLNKSVKEKIKESEQLTNTTALKILKQIKWKSDALAFLTKPIVFNSLSIAVLSTLAFIPPVDHSSFAVGSLVAALGGGMLGLSIEGSLNGCLSQLSQAYSDRGKRASDHIKTLEANPQEITIILA